MANYHYVQPMAKCSGGVLTFLCFGLLFYEFLMYFFVFSTLLFLLIK